jgi:hypothetical protein
MHESFNQSGFSKFLNSLAGRIFRLVAGAGFLVAGYIYRDLKTPPKEEVLVTCSAQYGGIFVETG